MSRTWTLEDALAICRTIESVAPEFGCHVALTGGLLYKEGPRKDVDIVVYRIRQRESIDVDGLFQALATIGIVRVTPNEVWCIKAKREGRTFDFFFPEAESGHYIEHAEAVQP